MLKNLKKHKYFVCIIVLMLGLATILSGCAAKNDVTEPITKENSEPAVRSNDDTQTEKTKKLIGQIINQAVNGDLSTDTITELENMGIDSKMIAAFKETVVSIDNNASLKDGVYTGTGDAHNGDIVIEVTIYKGKILYIDPVEHSETAPKLEKVFKSIPLEVLREQSAQDVDTVSGATQASNGYIEAIQEALSKAQR